MRYSTKLNLIGIFLVAIGLLAALPAQAALITFNDPDLENAVASAIGAIPPIDDSQVVGTGFTMLNASSSNIDDLTGLEACTDLTRLYLRANQIDDASNLNALAGLTNLTNLDLGSNQISILAPLSTLTNLTNLKLDSNQIVNLAPLNTLTSLTWLDLGGNSIVDVSDLVPLINLSNLFLDSNSIVDICALEGNAGLAAGDNVDLLGNLSLDQHALCGVIPALEARGVSVAYVGSCTDVLVVFADPDLETEVRNTTGILTCPILDTDLVGVGFTSLNASSSTISDLGGIEYCTDLTQLSLSDNQIVDISPLEYLTSLTSLDLWNNQIADITPLVANAGIDAGDIVWIDANPLNQHAICTDIPALEGRTVTVFYDGTCSDTVAPTVAMTSGAANPTNAVIPVTVTFSENVTGFVLGDITAGNGATSNFAGGPAVYTFDLTPTADGAVTADIASGVAEDAVGNLNTAAPQFSITYDGTAPGVALASGVGDPTNAAFSVTATFTEVVTGLLDTEIVVANGTVSNFVDVSGDVYTFDVTPTADGAVTVDIPVDVAEDAATNLNTVSNQIGTTYDTTGPGVTLTSGVGALTNGAFSVTATFTEVVTGLLDTEIVVVNGTVSNFVDVSGDDERQHGVESDCDDGRSHASGCCFDIGCWRLDERRVLCDGDIHGSGDGSS